MERLNAMLKTMRKSSGKTAGAGADDENFDLDALLQDDGDL